MLSIAIFLTIIFIYDLQYQLIPHRTVLVFTFIFFIIFAVLSPESLVNRVLAVLAAGGFFLFQYLISRGRWIGVGDIYLGIFMGVILGWPQILAALLIAYVSGACFSLFLLAIGSKKLQSRTPFGTYLAVATLVTMLWGKIILEWYISLL